MFITADTLRVTGLSEIMTFDLTAEILRPYQLIPAGKKGLSGPKKDCYLLMLYFEPEREGYRKKIIFWPVNRRISSM